MHNLTKIASLPQGGGCKAALVGEVQSARREKTYVDPAEAEATIRLMVEMYTRPAPKLWPFGRQWDGLVGDGSSD